MTIRTKTSNLPDNPPVPVRAGSRAPRKNVIQDRRMKEDAAVLRWGGLAGILGGIVMIVVFVIVAVFVGADALDPGGSLERFPEIRAARTLENGLYLVALVLWMVHFLALYRALRETNVVAALVGSVLGIVGLGVLAAGALPHVATLPISDLYHAPGATSQDQAALVLMWQAALAMFDALLGTGLLILTAGLIALGVAMIGAPAFGKGFAGLSLALGGLGLVAASVFLIVPPSPVVGVGVLGLTFFHVLVGWKVSTLARVSMPRFAGAGAL